MVLRNISIEDTELLDDGAAFVRQARIAEMLRIGKAAQDFIRIVGDNGDVDAMLLETAARLLQLHELAAAVGSPIGAAGEHQEQAIASREVAKISLLAILIWKLEFGNFRADVQSAGRAGILGVDEFAEFLARDFLAAKDFPHDIVEEVRLARTILTHRLTFNSVL